MVSCTRRHSYPIVDSVFSALQGLIQANCTTVGYVRPHLVCHKDLKLCPRGEGNQVQVSSPSAQTSFLQLVCFMTLASHTHSGPWFSSLLATVAISFMFYLAGPKCTDMWSNITLDGSGGVFLDEINM